MMGNKKIRSDRERKMYSGYLWMFTVQGDKMRKKIGALIAAIALMGLLGAQFASANELPAGYHWVYEGGPSDAKLVDEAGNTVDYQTVMAEAGNAAKESAATDSIIVSHEAVGPGAANTDASHQGDSAAITTEGEGAAAGSSEMADAGTENPDSSQEAENQESGAATETEETHAENPRGIDPSKPMIALTFDDGPYAPVGNRIMDVMIQNNSRCTFFVVGERVPMYEKEMKRMAEEGFEIANHTQNHKYLNGLSASAIRAQVQNANAAIASVAGVTPTLFRLPGGIKNSTVMSNINMPVILWNIDTLDWKHKNPQKTLDAVLGKAKDGDIILMHELYAKTADAVEIMVPKLIEQGFQLVTVSELIEYKGIQVESNKIYSQFR